MARAQQPTTTYLLLGPLKHRSDEVDYASESIVYEEGDHASHLYLVYAGAQSGRNPGRKEACVRFLGPIDPQHIGPEIVDFGFPNGPPIGPQPCS